MRDRELRSLNLSTSVALAAYEIRRQWGWTSEQTTAPGLYSRAKSSDE